MEKRKPWFRWYRDTVMDAKLRFVHRRASDLAWPNRHDRNEMVVSLTDVVASWALILESVTDDNGSVTVPLHHTVADYISEALDMDTRHAQAIIEAMQDYSLLTDTGNGLEVTNWKRRQYLDDTNAERQARYREKHKRNGSVTESNGERNGSVTHRQNTESESDSDKKSYRFLGQTIRIDLNHYNRWAKTFHRFPDLETQLLKADEWISRQDEATRAKWPFVVPSMLAKWHDKLILERVAAKVGPQFKTAIEDKPRESQEQREAALSKWEQRRRELADAVVRCNDEGEKRKPRQPKPPKARVRHLLPTSPAMDHAEEDEAEAGRKALPN